MRYFHRSPIVIFSPFPPPPQDDFWRGKLLLLFVCLSSFFLCVQGQGLLVAHIHMTSHPHLHQVFINPPLILSRRRFLPSVGCCCSGKIRSTGHLRKAAQLEERPDAVGRRPPMETGGVEELVTVWINNSSSSSRRKNGRFF